MRFEDNPGGLETQVRWNLAMGSTGDDLDDRTAVLPGPCGALSETIVADCFGSPVGTADRVVREG